MVHGTFLHRVGVPGGEVTLGVGPGDGGGHGDDTDWIHEATCFRSGDELVVVLREPRIDKTTKKVENAGVLPLVLAEGFEIHKEVDEGATQAVIVNPLLIFGGGEGPFFPVAVTEAKGDVVGKAVVFE